MRIFLYFFIFLHILFFPKKNLFAQIKTQFKVTNESGQPMSGLNVNYKKSITSRTNEDGIAEARITTETLKRIFLSKGEGISVTGQEIQKIEINEPEHLFLIRVRTTSGAMQPVIVQGSIKDNKGNILNNFTITFVSYHKNIRKEVTTDDKGNFSLQFGNEKEWKDFFAKDVDILPANEGMEVDNAQMTKTNIALTFKKKELIINKAENKKEEKKNTLKIEANGNESAAQVKDTTSRQETASEQENKDKETANPEWLTWVELHLRNPKEIEKLADKERKIYIISQINLVKKDNEEINEQIKSLQDILKNDNTLSEKEKLNLTEELNKLKRKLYLNKLALGELETQLSEFEKSFLEKYRNLLLGAIFIVLVLSMIIYLMALLARSRKKQHDILLQKNKEIEEKNIKITEEQQASEKLLLNILPATTAQELKKNGKVEPRLYNSVTTLFTDFKGFSGMAKNLTPQEVISQLAFYFEGFEKICKDYKLEKIKTIGDAFMAVAGLPLEYEQHAICAAGAGLAMQRFINDNPPPLATVWGVRIGLHTGEAVAGVIGQSKFAYDIWGNAVNVASRMESSGEAGEVQISSTTYEKIKNVFLCEERGKVEAKNIGEINAYFVKRILPEYAQDKNGFVPNDKFWEMVKK